MMTAAARAAVWLRRPLAVLGFSYLVGAVPFSNLVARRRAGVDLRDVGSGTVSGTSLFEVAGFGPLAIAGVADVAKGSVGPLLAGPDRPILAALAGGAAVCGHNWSVFLGGAGGRGISPALGALAVRNWPGAATLIGSFGVFRLANQSGLGCFVGDLALVPVLARTRGRDGALAGAVVVVPMLTKRIAGNHAPTVRNPSTYLARLILDSDTWRSTPAVKHTGVPTRPPEPT